MSAITNSASSSGPSVILEALTQIAGLHTPQAIPERGSRAYRARGDVPVNVGVPGCPHLIE